MCVRVISGGRVVLLFLFLILTFAFLPSQAFGADLLAHEALERYRSAQSGSIRHARTMGVIEYRQSDGDGRVAGESGRSSTVSVAAKANRRIGAGWNVQGNVKHRHSELNGDRRQRTQGTAHLYHRDPERYALGAFGSLATERAKPATAIAGDEWKRVDSAAGGLEAALFSEKTTLLAAAGLRRKMTEQEESDSAFTMLGARYYVTDQFRLGLQGTYERPLTIEDDPVIYGLGAEVSYRPHELPFSSFGGYRYQLAQADGSAEKTVSHGVFAGFRYHFGSHSLKEEERYGPLWPDLPIDL